jgi:hypothetical protein
MKKKKKQISPHSDLTDEQLYFRIIILNGLYHHGQTSYHEICYFFFDKYHDRLGQGDLDRAYAELTQLTNAGWVDYSPKPSDDGK